jgi:hypothetical protein
MMMMMMKKKKTHLHVYLAAANQQDYRNSVRENTLASSSSCIHLPQAHHFYQSAFHVRSAEEKPAASRPQRRVGSDSR